MVTTGTRLRLSGVTKSLTFMPRLRNLVTTLLSAGFGYRKAGQQSAVVTKALKFLPWLSDLVTTACHRRFGYGRFRGS